MLKIIVISGPTASGKTKKAIKFCKENNGEIISADSRQIYKYLDVGTNKEGTLVNGIRQIEGINQYLTDIIEPNKIYSVANFINDADKKIIEITKNGKLPVIVGGTGLYIKGLLYGLDEMPKANETLRKELSKLSSTQLYEKLLKLDIISAQKNKSNPQRLLRALEINILSGKTVSSFYKEKSKRYDFVHYTMIVDTKTLYQKINDRCKFMIENGMIEETKKCLKNGFDKDCPALSGIGYRDIIKYLNGEIDKTQLLENFSKDTRHYAKRQNTWFKAQKDIIKI